MGIVSLKLITMLQRHASYLDILSHGKITPQRCCVMKADPAPLPPASTPWYNVHSEAIV